jgi:RNA polymerase sigma-70 factor (ECF subfamily)
MGRQERQAQVQAAIADLPEPQRTALVLAKYEGLSVDRIAEVLGCSRDAAKMRVSRALGTLREKLA